ncbi:MAG TPA: hypothetical protein VEI26_09285 [Terriglobales bacterium]|nr:hypothetical protein [Terriglobales bacterium]
MVKHSLTPGMGKFLTRERFGHPQVYAGLLLLIFLGQCCWLLFHGTSPLDVDSSELFRVQEGLRQWQGGAIAGTPSPERMEAASPPPIQIEENQGFDPNHSPLWYLLDSAPFAVGRVSSRINSVQYWGWLARLPYIAIGLLLGASLWYVARRLYGNAGGYIALTLYCFSPAILRSSTLWLTEPEIGAAWGTFGAIFTAIAVAHTLYAPREVVLWNWRRILLLGLSLAVAVGCQFSLVILLPITLAFMLYVAPTRNVAAFVIWACALGVALLILLAAYGFRGQVFWQGIRHAHFFGFTWLAFAMRGGYQHAFIQLVQAGPALLIALPVALFTYAAWRRTRYFGNTAPLLLALLFVLLGVATPHIPGAFIPTAIPLLCVFVSGIAADLLETRQRAPVVACVSALLTANALINLTELARVGRG